MPEVIRILLIENQKLIRIGIESVIASDPSLAIVAEADNGTDGIRLFKELRPDVTILGLRMPDSCALDFLDGYFAADPRARIIILADHAGDTEITKALKKGALGYVCKDVDPPGLIRAVKTVAKGSKFIPAEIAAVLSEHIGSEELTRSETRTLQMIVGGMSNKEIAFALDVTENTVKTHVKNIFEKLNVSDRTSAATTAIKRGMVRVDF